MTAQEYIISQLDVLKEPFVLGSKPRSDTEMVDAIIKFLFSKKFRKFSIPEKNRVIIQTAIKKNIANKEPIKISWPFGGYKLWHLEESPEVDWAELFSIIYFIRWLKPVCAIYPYGVVFTFWFDEVIINQLNNIPQSDLDEYRKSFENLLTFIHPWLHKNMQFEIFLERMQYESNEAFQTGLNEEMEKLAKARSKNPKPLSDKERRSIEMNVKLIPEQAKDLFWREKVDLMHYAYYNLQEKQNRVRSSYTTDNITAFTTFFEPNVIPIGTTKTSIAKFWVGVGALQRRGNSFIETILSPSQLEKANFSWEPVNVKGLNGKNFNRIRVIKRD